MIKRDDVALAICIALLPPIWATLAPHIGVQTGAVSLICAALYVLCNNDYTTARPLTLGLLLGDCWAYLAVKIMDWSSLPGDIELFCTLAVMGGAAVLISAPLAKYVSCSAWLCGWAIGLTVLTPLKQPLVGSYALQVGVAMVVGIWYVGVLLNLIQRKLVTWNHKS